MTNIKKLLFCLILVIAFAIQADAALRWSLDFENGFNASSGTVDISRGNLGNPFDTSQEIYLLYDADSDSNVVRIGRTWQAPYCYLSYVNLASDILGPSGRVTIDFKIPVDFPVQCTSMTFFNSSTLDGLLDWQNQWLMMLSKPETASSDTRQRGQVQSNCWPGSGFYYLQQNWSYVLMPNPAAGWHTMEFEWYRLENNYPERDRADIRLKLDGETIFAYHDVLWTWPNTNLTIGCQRTGLEAEWGNTTRFHTGYPQNVLLDNIQIWDYTPQECGAPGAMEYLDGDVDKNCFVDFKDVKNFAEEWLQCTNPDDSRCDEYWR
ncbi:MAG: hypothetical protein A2Y10_02390 [Planctomycetes bacterium GWF2_41_51]|nr:MAG: hypothetical protein A2Y10_02390 [Planctomycetes bacterium GWF2_41_51]HBG27282.1 hypothetical protein [Phycisphaerales bacterium]